MLLKPCLYLPQEIKQLYQLNLALKSFKCNHIQANSASLVSTLTPYDLHRVNQEEPKWS